jgi:hypothetical protein
MLGHAKIQLERPMMTLMISLGTEGASSPERMSAHHLVQHPVRLRMMRCAREIQDIGRSQLIEPQQGPSLADRP